MTVTIVVDKAGVVYWALYEGGDYGDFVPPMAEPTAASVIAEAKDPLNSIAANMVAVSDGVPVDIVIDSLSSNTVYSFYAVSVNAGGNRSDRSARLRVPGDRTPPIITAHPEMVRRPRTSAVIQLTSNENGKIFWVLYPQGAAAPATNHALVAAAHEGAGVKRSGDMPVSTAFGNDQSFIFITGLQAHAAYDLYAVVVDNAGNRSALTSKISVPASEDAPSAHTPWQLDGARGRIEMHRKGDTQLQFSVAESSPLPSDLTVDIEQMEHQFNFGGTLTELSRTGIVNPNSGFNSASLRPYFDAFKELFNYATVGFYWEWHEQSRGAWRLRRDTATAIAFAQENNIRIRGHPILWDWILPDWVNAIESSAERTRVLERHITDTVGRYPFVYEWDLVNEPPAVSIRDERSAAYKYFSDHGGTNRSTHRLHRVAVENNPSARFLVNHYNYRGDSYHDVIRYLINNGTHIPAIGIQSRGLHEPVSDLDTHLFTVPAEDQLWTILERFAAHDVPLHLSEVVFYSHRPFKDWRDKRNWEKIHRLFLDRGENIFIPSDPEGERFQAAYLKDYYTLAFSHPSVETIIYWAVADLEGRSGDGVQGGLLDRQFRPKPSYRALHNLIKTEWWTVQRDVPFMETVDFQGFYGDYRVTLSKEGRVMYEGRFTLDKNNPVETLPVILSPVSGGR